MRRKRLTGLLLVFLMGSVCIAGCGGGGGETATAAPETQTSEMDTGQETPAVETSKSAESDDAAPVELASRDTAFGLLNHFVSGGQKENVVFSPYSLDFALGLLANGADETTRGQICAIMGVNSIEELNEKLGAAMTSSEAHNLPADEYEGELRLSIANGLFIAEGYDLNPDYHATISSYRAELETVDFIDSQTVGRINAWASEKTEGRIPFIISELPSPELTRLVAINAVYFQGGWATEFYPYDGGMTFRGSNGDSKVEAFQRGGFKAGYYEDADLQFVSMPFRGGEYSMFFALPKDTELGALEAMIQSMSKERLQEMLAGGGEIAKNYELLLRLPKFQQEYVMDELMEDLTALGLNLHQSSFDDMLANPDAPLLLNQLIQRAMIEVDENGVVAAAVTAGVETAGAALEEEIPAQYEMVVNRPFFYGIVDGGGNLIFLGATQNL